jgi:hypothetical protein
MWIRVFSKQHELRLDLHVEAAGGLEEPFTRKLPKLISAMRLLEDRLAHGADRGFELLDPGAEPEPSRIPGAAPPRGDSRGWKNASRFSAR